MGRVNILGVGINDESKPEMLRRITEMVVDEGKHYIVTPNPEFVILAQKDKRFAEILAEADLAIPDGIGLVLASRFLHGKKKGLRERITGVDLMTKICQIARKKKWAIFLLGAEEGIAEKCAQILKEKYGLTILGAHSGWADKTEDKKNQAIIKKQIGSRECHFIFVAYGAGKQEKWIKRNLGKIPVRVAMGVGGAFDFLSGKVDRAPRVIRQLGLEWLWRLIKEPWRWRRQTALLRFVFLVIKEKLRRYSFLS